MKYIKAIIFLISIFLTSCASPYLKSYEPINDFIEAERKNKSHIGIIIKEKIENKQTLRIFNSMEGPDHIIDPSDIDTTNDLFVNRHWKKMYKKYANAKTEGWNQEDFDKENFIVVSIKDLEKNSLYKSQIPYIVHISEPIYYHNRNYIMFYYSASFSKLKGIIIMKKVKNEWVFYKNIGDYIFS